MKEDELKEVLRKHKLCLEGKKGGVRCDLRSADFKMKLTKEERKFFKESLREGILEKKVSDLRSEYLPRMYLWIIYLIISLSGVGLIIYTGIRYDATLIMYVMIPLLIGSGISIHRSDAIESEYYIEKNKVLNKGK